MNKQLNYKKNYEYMKKYTYVGICIVTITILCDIETLTTYKLP